AYYWVWQPFEWKLRKVVRLLSAGQSLHQSLRAAPGVAPREVLLAAAVGESTGRLAPSLRNAPRWRLTPVWLDAMPRFLYPIGVMIALGIILSFLTVFIVPKLERIFADFHVSLPAETRLLLGAMRSLSSVVLGLISIVGFVVLLLASPTL